MSRVGSVPGDQGAVEPAAASMAANSADASQVRLHRHALSLLPPIKNSYKKADT